MIGIIGAMEEEVAALKEAMTIEENVTFASMDFCRGTLCGKEVVVVRSGIGKVNAAICTQILVDKFGVDTLDRSNYNAMKIDALSKAKEKVKYTLEINARKDKDGNWEVVGLTSSDRKKIQGMY